MKRSIYALQGKDKVKIGTLAKRIYDEREERKGRILDWDVFTIEYMNFPLPTTDLDRVLYSRYRTTWVVEINKVMVKQKYACKLFVAFDKGISILINGSASELTIRKKTRKISNTLEATVEAIEELKECFPTASKLLEVYHKIILDNQYTFLGRIENSNLPAEIKRELKRIIQKGLPPSEE